MNKLKLVLLLLTFAWIAIQTVSSQTSEARTFNNESSLLWEVSGKGLKEPSYLFGTFHLLGRSFVDSLPVVMEKFNECKTFAGEMKIDSTMVPKMTEAAFLKGTTLDQILSKADYDSTALWLKELTGYDLSLFNTANPMTVSTVLSAYVQQKVFPQSASGPEPMMDEYYQQLSKQNGKPITGLETIDEQLNAIFFQFSTERQAELLMAMVKQKDKVAESMLQMLTSYKQSDLNGLMSLMYDETFTKTETEVMLDNRNMHWMKQLPSMMHQSSVFIAVGALHLAGTNGLVQLLRNAGYTVKPLNI